MDFIVKIMKKMGKNFFHISCLFGLS